MPSKRRHVVKTWGCCVLEKEGGGGIRFLSNTTGLECIGVPTTQHTERRFSFDKMWNHDKTLGSRDW